MVGGEIVEEREYAIEECKIEPITLPDSQRMKTVLNIAEITERSTTKNAESGEEGSN